MTAQTPSQTFTNINTQVMSGISENSTEFKLFPQYLPAGQTTNDLLSHVSCFHIFHDYWYYGIQKTTVLMARIKRRSKAPNSLWDAPRDKMLKQNNQKCG